MMNRKKLILAILVVVFIAALIYGFVATPRQKRAEKLTFKPGAVASVVKVAPKPVADDKTVHLEMLAQEPPHFSGYRRNIFLPIPVHEAKIAAIKKAKAYVPPPPPPPPPPPAPPPPPPPPPTVAERALSDMATYTFLGFLQKGSRKTIFLSHNKEIVLVKKGDTIKGPKNTYTVTQVSEENMTIIPAGSGEEIVIPFMAGQPPAPGK